jgi:transposase InsO family protein
MVAKDEDFNHAQDFILRLQNEFPKNAMKVIQGDNDTEFKNTYFKIFYASLGLEHQFSSTCVRRQNGIIERNSRILIEMARTMLDEQMTSKHFWAKAINVVCDVSNHIFLHAFLNKTSYELRFRQPPKVSHFKVFGCRCFVLKQGNLVKFESWSSNGVFLVMLYTPMLTEFLTLRLTESWRLVR